MIFNVCLSVLGLAVESETIAFTINLSEVFAF